MLDTILSVMGTFNTATAHDFFSRLSGIFNGSKENTARYLEQINDNLAGLNIQAERLTDNILYAPLLESAQDITQSQQQTINDKREVVELLAPVQRSLGEEVLSSAMILTPEKMQRAFNKNPWEVLSDIQPLSLAVKSTTPNMIPMLFHHEGDYYIGWQMRGILKLAFDCQYDEQWVPATTPSITASISNLDDSPEIIVTTRGQIGDYHTISEAIEQAQAGSRILVKPGFYQESLVIDKPLQIIGEGDVADIVIESRDGICVQMQTDQALVRGLTLQCRAGSNDKGGIGVYMPQGKLILEHCDITSDSLVCIYMCGSKTAGIISHCRIHDSHQVGVFVHDKAAGRIEYCDIFGNASVGIAIKTGGNPTVQHCQIHDNKQGGVFIWENATGQIENCDIFKNGFDGIAIKTGGNPTIQHCQIHDNKTGGVYAYENGTGILKNCDIYRNGKVGIIISDGGNPTARNCTIKQHASWALLATKGKGTIENCDLRDNAEGARRIDEESEMHYSGNRE
jgi:parallel beta-helix repeat protein